MTIPTLPISGATSWYPWAQGIHQHSFGVTWTINVCDLGAVGDYNPLTQVGTNSTTAFTSAVSQASTLMSSNNVSSVAIYVPAGHYLTEKIPALPHRCTFYGDGPGATRLYRKATGTTTGAFISNQSTAQQITLRGLSLDCRNIGDTTSHGVSLDNATTNEWTDARHFVTDLFIQYSNGNGLQQSGHASSLVTRVSIMQANGHGFVPGTDSVYSDCDAGVSGLDGFYLSGSNTRLTGCKAWYSGAVSTSGATGGTGHGFHFADGNFSPNMLAGCEAQDNARAGYFLSNVGRHVLVGCVADSNNSAAAGLTHAGFELLAAFNNVIVGFAFDRASNTNHQIAAVRIDGNGGGNIVDVVPERSSMAQGAITTDSTNDTSGSRVSFGAASYASNTGTYTSSTLNFPLNRGDVFTGTLTQNTTVGLITNQPGAQRKVFILKQDATGSRTVTWPKPGSPTLAAPAIYWAGGTAPTMTVTANATDVYELTTVDGVRWYGRVIAANVS